MHGGAGSLLLRHAVWWRDMVACAAKHVGEGIARCQTTGRSGSSGRLVE